jgi:hypothetical protein
MWLRPLRSACPQEPPDEGRSPYQVSSRNNNQRTQTLLIVSGCCCMREAYCYRKPFGSVTSLPFQSVLAMRVCLKQIFSVLSIYLARTLQGDFYSWSGASVLAKLVSYNYQVFIVVLSQLFMSSTFPTSEEHYF